MTSTILLGDALIARSRRAFSKQEAERHGLQPYAKTNYGKRVVLPGSGSEFEDGYEIKWVSMRNITLDDVGPSVEELTHYNQVPLPSTWFVFQPSP